MGEWAQWLTAEQAKRGWSLREIARRGDIDPSELSRMVRGERPLTHSFAEGIARAFGVDAFFVKRLGGLETAKVLEEMHPAVVELARRIDNLPLSDGEKEQIVRTLAAQVDLYTNLMTRKAGEPDPLLERVRQADPALAADIEKALKEERA
jgi:transcriptional regulator with XRE-family HTH domain